MTTQYRQANPLGGPAKVFDAMAAAVRAGDSFDSVLSMYGFSLSQPEQQPVTDDRKSNGGTFDTRRFLAARLICWHRLTTHESDELVSLFDASACGLRATCGLSDAPPKPQPLTDEQMKDCLDAADQMYCERDGDKELFKGRAVEAAHNIGAKP